MLGRLKNYLFGTLPNDATKYYNGVGAFSVPTPGSDWTATVTKGSDESVGDSTTLQNDDELLFTPSAGKAYLLELVIKYTGSRASANDFVWDFSCSAGTMTGVFNSFARVSGGIGDNNILANGITNTTDITCEVNGAGVLQTLRIIGTVVFSNSCTFNFRFAQLTAGVGTSVTCESGSILRYKDLGT